MEAQSCNVKMYTPVRLWSAVSLPILIHFQWPYTISFLQNQLFPECTVLWNIKCLACKTSNIMTVLSEVGSLYTGCKLLQIKFYGLCVFKSVCKFLCTILQNVFQFLCAHNNLQFLIIKISQTSSGLRYVTQYRTIQH